jgi:HEAT repeat protein
VAVCSRGNAEPRAALRKLLKDKMPSVRLRASLALGRANDPKAVSTLIVLLGEVTTEQAREIEAFLGDLAQEQAPNAPVGEDEESRKRARDAWARWWLDTEGPGLLEEVKKRTLTEDLHKKTLGLIENLADDSFEVRQGAEEQLRKMGAVIKPLLKQALKHEDLEVRTRVGKCLAALEKEKAPPLSAVTAKLIALRKPKGAAEALLAYVPFQEDDEAVQEQIQKALNAVAYEGGKANLLVVKALADKSPFRRAAAAEALCHGPMAPHLKSIRALLLDKQPMVRLRVALALSGANEPEGVPVLTTLVGEGPSELGAQAEEYLAKVAGSTAPKGLPEGEDGRKKRSVAWAKWWAEHKGSVALIDRNAPTEREPYRNFTLLIQTNINRIEEVDRNNKTRWSIAGLLNPWEAQVLPGNRVLITEYSGQRVTERNFKGDVLWEHRIPNYPMYAERLKNGNTFIVCRNQLFEVTRGKKEVLRIDRPSHDVMSARKLPNGQIVIVTNTRQVVRLDRTGKQLKSFPITQVVYNSNEVLDNGNVLIPMGWNNRVEEYDPSGKMVRMITAVMQPVHAVRLPNGNTLIASSQSFPGYKAFEVDRTGKVVREVQMSTYSSRVRRR